MMTTAGFPSYRAPQRDGEILCVPSWSDVAGQLATQRDGIAKSAVEIAGAPLSELAAVARHELIAQATKYTSAYVEGNITASDEGPLVVTGHQPGFVHAGVWLKNFAASQLADQAGGVAVSLIIDNDLCRAPSIRVPTGTVEQPQVVDVPFDQPQADVPWEERAIADRSLWNSFGERVAETIGPLLAEPLIQPWWPEVVKQSEQTPLLGLALTRARHRLELEWGSRTLELPQSYVCQTEAFRRFAAHLLLSAEQLRTDYNGALSVYREAHGLRSAAQPLPDLAEVDGWTETPFWIWTEADPTRRALYVQPSADGLSLTDRRQWQTTLPPDPEKAMQALAELENDGIKIRTRALITTLYARLLLADVFIHGIGGAKYDQVTNLLSQRFYGVDLPEFLTMSGTLRLPLAHETIPSTRATELRQSLRQLRYHPETRIPQVELDQNEQTRADALVEEKRHWVQTAKTPANAAERHAGIEAANAALQPFLQSQRSELEAALAATVAQSRANQILESREYPFCLFPSELLRSFLLDFSPPMA